MVLYPLNLPWMDLRGLMAIQLDQLVEQKLAADLVCLQEKKMAVVLLAS